MNNVLITGGAGFVGRHFTKRLLTEGCRITTIDNLCSTGTKAPEPQNNLVFLQGDCRDFFRNTPHCEFDTVIHLAAVVGGRLKIDGDPLAVATDLAIDADLFNWLARVPKKPQLLYFSSSAAYSTNLQTELWKDIRLFESLISFDMGNHAMPDMTYGWAKLTGEYLAGFAARQYGLDVKIYRPFSGYGPGQSFDYPFPSIVRRVMNGENPVTVWGSGDQLRDFIYIDDIVDAVLETKDRLAPGEALNLGSGVGVSFKELALRTAAVLGREVTVVNDPTKPEGVFARVADVTRFRALYPSPLTPLEDGIVAVARALTEAQNQGS